MTTKIEIETPGVIMLAGNKLILDGVAVRGELIMSISCVVTVRLSSGDEIIFYPDDVPQFYIVISHDDTKRVKDLIRCAMERKAKMV